MVKKQITQSVYGIGPKSDPIESHTLSILVDNEPGVLARVIGLYSGRGYNIESLTVAETDHSNNLSRITLICSGTPLVIEQIKNQLNRLVPVHRVTDLTLEGQHVERELALVKISGNEEKRAFALRIAETYQARLVHGSADTCVFEISDTSARLDEFIASMRGHGMIDVSRTGVAAMSKNVKAI